MRLSEQELTFLVRLFGVVVVKLLSTLGRLLALTPYVPSYLILSLYLSLIDEGDLPSLRSKLNSSELTVLLPPFLLPLLLSPLQFVNGVALLYAPSISSHLYNPLIPSDLVQAGAFSHLLPSPLLSFFPSLQRHLPPPSLRSPQVRRTAHRQWSYHLFGEYLGIGFGSGEKVSLTFARSVRPSVRCFHTAETDLISSSL